MPRTKTNALPFHTNLNGYERVNRAFARKTWSWGLPVWQDSGKGAVRLAPPGRVPMDGARTAFDAECLDKMGLDPSGGFTESCRRRCVYLIPWGIVGVHFVFDDGSNPFVKYGQVVELIPEIWAWARRWVIRPDAGNAGTISHFRLKEKRPAAKDLFVTGL